MFSVTGLALVLALSGVIDPPEKPRLQDPDDVLSGATKVLFWDSLRLWQEAGLDVYVDIRKSLDEPPTEVSARRIKTWVGEKRVGAVYVCDVEKRQYALTLSTDAKALVPEAELVQVFNDAMRMPYVNGSIDLIVTIPVQRVVERLREEKFRRQDVQVQDLTSSRGGWRLLAIAFAFLLFPAAFSIVLLRGRVKKNGIVGPPPPGGFLRVRRRRLRPKESDLPDNLEPPPY